jgi:hypothetical protein
MVPRTRTSVEIDRRTRKLYEQRNSIFAGTYYPEEDFAPPLLPEYKQSSFDKTIYK